MDEDVCSVCCENFNKTRHKKVSCLFCDYDSCKECCQTYLLSTDRDPHCMNCHTRWDRHFVDNFCTKKFRNVDYKHRRENVLLERQKLLMPDTQPDVERIIQMRKLGAILRGHKQRLVELHGELQRSGRDIISNPEMTIIYRSMETVYRNLERLRDGIRSETSVEPRKFVHKCPTEDCKGFLSENWYCGLCENYFCEKCYDLKTEDHVCNPDTVKTMELIRGDSKPCPKCGYVIHKTDGCAQMWCTNCHCAFSWKTGEIEKGRIHNPHFIQYKKKIHSSREHGDIPCGGIPTFRELRVSKASSLMLQHAIVIYEIERVNTFLDTRPADTMNPRIGYMLGDISEVDFKSILQKQEKFTDKVRDINDIYEMIVHTGGDVLRQYILEPDRQDHFVTVLDGILDYSNEVMGDIRKRYNCKLPKNINV